ncbi:MAG: hypothetical protein IT462_08510 [Planctomycetes bacterium]|nr:hypothetical protein [Planctomycetota bacterium]
MSGMQVAPENPSPQDEKPRNIGSVASLAPLVLILALTIVYDQFKHQLRGHIDAAGITYADWVGNFINSPDNEAARTELISRVVGVMRDTPVGKSLPLRDEQQRVIGRFRINEATVSQPAANSPIAQERRRYDVRMKGDGELWHSAGGRVRFSGSADVQYVINTNVVAREFKVYAYFDCLEIREITFEITHVDNLLARIFSGFVNDAGKRAIQEGIMPGFTIITQADGKSYVAPGRATLDFKPREGPNKEEQGWETLSNDVRLLRKDFRDYLGPFQAPAGAELRINLTVAGEGGKPAPGVDLLLVHAEAFKQYDDRYMSGTPGNMAGLEIAAVEQRWSTRELAYAGRPEPGMYYLVIDRTVFGKGDQTAQLSDIAAEVSYYVRMKR